MPFAQEGFDALRLQRHQLRESVQRLREAVEPKVGLRQAFHDLCIAGTELERFLEGVQRLLALAYLLTRKAEAIIRLGIAALAPQKPARRGARTRKNGIRTGDREKEEDSDHRDRHAKLEMFLPTHSDLAIGDNAAVQGGGQLVDHRGESGWGCRPLVPTRCVAARLCISD